MLMKTLLMTLCFGLLYSTAIGQWQLGARAGVSLSDYKTQTPWKEALNQGFVFGLTGYKSLTTNIGLQAGFEYIEKGYYHKVCNTITDKFETTYLEIPLAMDHVFRLRAIQHIELHATLGFYAAYWISGKYTTTGFGTTSDPFDFKKNHASRIDLGSLFGGRIAYVLKKGTVSLDLRYEMGLIDLEEQSENNSRNTNRALVIGVGYTRIPRF